MSRSNFSVPPNPEHESELRAIEAGLGSLAPARSGVNRDRVMYLAGQASARSRWAWPSATAALAILALGEGALLALRPMPEPRVVERIVEVPAPSPASTAPVVILRQNPAEDRDKVDLGIDSPFTQETGTLARQDSYHLRNQALRFGVEGLPEPPPLAANIGPNRDDESFRSEIQSILDPGGTL